MLFAAELLKPGTPAPTFGLLDQRSHRRTLEEDLLADSTIKGVVLLFFAWDRFPGDIRMLQDYADAYSKLQQAGINVAGISAINWETLHHLAQRLHLPYPLLFDPCARVSKKYQTMLIPKFVTGRAVYAIDTQCIIRHAQKEISPEDALAVVKDFL